MTQRTEPSQESFPARLRRLQETVQLLSSAPGYKAMLRRFGEVLGSQLGVRRISFARVTGRGGKLALKRRNVRVDKLETHADGLLETLAQALGATEGGVSVFREGCSAFAVDGATYVMTLVDDPISRQGCLVIWDPPAAEREAGEDAAALVDFLIRHVQGEGRWYRKLDKTQAMLYRDDLTGLFNGRYLDVVLDAELRRAERFGSQFCLLFLDLDAFKPINDQHGHLAGSSVLKQVAEVIRDAVREVDVPIRYGGDEFVVVLLGATCAKGMLAAERVRRRIEQKEFTLEDGKRARLTASIGIAAYPEHGQDRATLLKMADETMYDSKRAGKNRVTIVGARDRRTS